MYKPALRREGVLHEIEVLTERPLTAKAKEVKTEEGSSRGKLEDLALARAKLEEVRVKQEEDIQARGEPNIGTSSPSPAPEPLSERDESPQADREREERERERERHVIPIPVKRSSNTILDPQDAITLRAKVVRFKYMSGGEESTADPVFERLRGLLATLRDPGAGEIELRDAVKGIAALFAGGAGASVSSYELLKSGLVDGLLHFTTDTGLPGKFFFPHFRFLVMLTGDGMCVVDVTTRQQMVLQAFAARSGKGTDSPGSMSPFAVLVKKLQESLTRIENFEVVTVSPGAEGMCVYFRMVVVTHLCLLDSHSTQLCFDARTPTPPAYCR